MNTSSLRGLFVSELKDLYSAETQLIDALPKMVNAASSDDLKMAFEDHLQETREHVKRLRTVLSDMGERAEGETCEAMKGLIKEGESVIKSKGDANVKDAALIAAAQRVEHYEIAAYGTACTLADHLNMGDAKSKLGNTLDEEKSADSKLTKLAEGGWFSGGINEKAER